MPDRAGTTRGHRTEAGFTLIEILVAVVLLAIGVLATAQLVAGSESTSLDAELQQIATAEAENRVEEILSLPYAEMGHSATPGTPAGEAGRLTGTTFAAPGAGAEELVIAANDEAGDSISGVVGSAEVVQAEPISITNGSANLTGTAYTFVTWRDEECEPVDLTDLQSAVNDLRSDLTALRTTLNELISTVNARLVIGLLPSSIKSIYQSTVPGLVADLTASIDELDDLLAALATAEIDVCDLTQEAVDAMGGLVDPDGVGGFDASAEVLGVTAGISAATDFTVPTLVPPLSCNPIIPVPPFTAFCNNSQNLKTTIEAGGVSATITGVDGDAGDLAAELTNDTTHNTKRVTVGVVIDTARSDITPRNVVWVSEVVADPNEGLL